MVKGMQSLSNNKEKICADFNSEKYTLPELANKYGVEKSAMISHIKRWQLAGYCKQISLSINPNRHGKVNNMDEDRSQYWWEKSGLESKPVVDYTTEETVKVLEKSRYLIYTDGSCVYDDHTETCGLGGWAIVCLDRESNTTDEFYGCREKETPAFMELLAIWAAIEYVPSGESATIFTDSQQSCGLIDSINRYRENGWRNSFGQTPIHIDVLMNIHKAMEGKQITIQWVKGHNSDPSNERCDLLAKTAALKQIVCPLHDDKVEEKEEEKVEQDQLTVMQAAELLGTTENYLRSLIAKDQVKVDRNVRPMKISFDEITRLEDMKEKTGSFTGNPVPEKFRDWVFGDQRKNKEQRAKKEKEEKTKQEAKEAKSVKEEKRKGDDNKPVIECTKEEKEFAEMYFRYGPEMTAKATGMTVDEVGLKWIRFLLEYDVTLNIRKK